MRANLKPFAIIIAVCMLVVFRLQPAPSGAMAQETVFDYLEQALDNVVAQPASANLANYDGFTNGSCLFGVHLAEGDSHSFSARFDEGVNYLVLGAGDSRILDLDLALISSSGLRSVQTNDESAIPFLQFTPVETGEMRLKITNVYSLGDGFAVMLILEENTDGDFSLDQITEALDNLLTTPGTGNLTSSHFAMGTIALFGGRLGKGQSGFLYNTTPQAGNYDLVGASTNNIDNLDIFIYRQHQLNSTSGRLIARDADTENHARCSFAIDAGHYYLIRHKNRTSQDDIPGFVFSVLLQN